MYIAVVGGQTCTTEEDAVSRELGRLIAEEGHILICGGLGGVMESACEGAKSAGGTTVGILPGAFRSDANASVDIAIATDMGQCRNAIIVRSADAVIAVGGEYGTLSEIAMALKMGKRVIAVKSWTLARAGIQDDRLIEADDAASALALATGR
ncbi:MAG: TIGR00725 family protein [Candidatus Geothermincolia bacterium]